MIDILKKDFINGWRAFKFWAQTLSHRLKVEINILKLISEINKLNEEKDKLLIDLGYQIYNSGKTSFNLSDDEKLMAILRKIKEIELEIDDKKKKISDFGAID